MLACLIGYFGDFDLAEEAAAEAFAVAAQRWPSDGMPDNPGAWLVTTARHRAIDRLRRDRERFRGGFLGQVEVTEITDKASQYPAPLVAENLIDQRSAPYWAPYWAPYRAAWATTGRISTEPPMRAAGIRAAISVAWSRSSASTR